VDAIVDRICRQLTPPGRRRDLNAETFDSEKAAEMMTLINHKISTVREKARAVTIVRAKSKFQYLLLIET
jgi:hypothetical protein